MREDKKSLKNKIKKRGEKVGGKICVQLWSFDTLFFNTKEQDPKKGKNVAVTFAKPFCIGSFDGFMP